MTDIEIAKQCKMRPINEIAKEMGIDEEYIENYGKYKAKITKKPSENPKGKLVLVTAINPTPYGEGKTTVSIGLADGLKKLNKKVSLALREPSLGPVFGIKGGATGGGFAQVVPMEDINLHFTGDFHAITSANNLLSSLIDNHIKQGNELNLDLNRICHRRCMDLNDRALRQVSIALGGDNNGVPRNDGFDITSASEVMAILCLSNNLTELKQKLGNIIIGFNGDGLAVRAAEIKAEEAMAILLKDAIFPNLVQTLEHTPAFIHCGPFANIAHGCNSIVATKLAMSLTDIVVTEAGFGAELGTEKFLDIKCRAANIAPSAVVIVATARSLKYNGGASKAEVSQHNMEALKRGIVNLEKHIENITKEFNLPLVVAINKFVTDSNDELLFIKSFAESKGVKAVITEGWEKGGDGCTELAAAVCEIIENVTPSAKFAYPLTASVKEKIFAVATKIYGAKRVVYSNVAEDKLAEIEKNKEFSNFPICIAKTQYSFSSDPKALGRPTDYDFEVKDITVRGGSGFLVIVAGAIMLMPGLPKSPASDKMEILIDDVGDDNGYIIKGLF